MALGVLLSATGCSSAKITDVYMSRDEAARRRTNCFKPEWGHHYVFVEMFSASEQTILTPILRDGANAVIAYDAKDNAELAEFQNFAPGKGEGILLSIELSGPEDPKDSTKRLPLQAGNFTWEFYLDTHSTPDESVRFAVSPDCP